MVDTPYFAKTRKSASARRHELPAVEHKLRVWHPYLKYAADVLARKLAHGEARSAAVRIGRSPARRVSPTRK